MVPAAGEDELAAAPVGKYVVGDGFVYGCVDLDLFVTILSGRPDATAIAPLLRLYMIEHTVPRHRSLFDATALTGVDPEAFESLTAHLHQHHDVLERLVAKQATVRPSGLPGTVVDGFRAVFAFPYPEQVFVDRGEGLAWLGRSDALPAVTEMVAALAVDSIVSRVGALLAADPAITLDVAARRLHVSARSLQRRLDEAGTGFREAGKLAQLAQAKRLLVETDRKLTAIAAGLGFGSLQSFSASFRRATGLTPTQWRSRRR